MSIFLGDDLSADYPEYTEFADSFEDNVSLKYLRIIELYGDDVRELKLLFKGLINNIGDAIRH